eukprot:159272-Lingulodinium_polyedra.AAC.1
MLELVQRVRAVGPEVAVIVQLSRRRKTKTPLWVARWNELPHAPFKFLRTCSCKTGNTAPGCHLASL